MTKIHLGCGKDIKEGYINVDYYPFPGVDVVCDISKEKLPFEDSSADYVYSQDFLEHLPPESKIHVMNEIWRVLKNGGVMEHIVPNAGSRNDFGSPTHLSHWNLQQFEHFDVNSYRYVKDHLYEGFVGQFSKLEAELLSPLIEETGVIFQAFRVKYQAIK